MRPEAFSNPSGKLVRIDSSSEMRAFIPNPLPPSLTWNQELATVFGLAERNVGRLTSLINTWENPDLFTAPLIRREAVLSSKIEGTQTTLDALYQYEADIKLPENQHPRPAKDDRREVLNYVYATYRGLEMLRKQPMSLNLIRNLHRVLLSGVRGESHTPGRFRTLQYHIGPTTNIEDARYIPPPAPQMLDCLDLFEKYLNSEDGNPELVKLAYIHYQFEAIHPFGDGNGRLGRLLMTLLMLDWKLIPHPVLHLSDFLENHREEYYDSLLSVSQVSGWYNWVKFFLTCVASQAESTVIRLRQLFDLHKDWHQRLIDDRSAATVFKLLDKVILNPYITAAGASKLLDVHINTARRALKTLVKLEILVPVASIDYNQPYYARGIFNVLQAEDH